jgi:hypothetical protein
MDPMIYFELAGNKHFDELLEIIYYQDSLTSQPLLDLVQLTSEQFGQCLRSTGQVYRILSGSKLAGVCWIEHRGSHASPARADPEKQLSGQGDWHEDTPLAG